MSEFQFFDYDAQTLIDEAVTIFEDALGETCGDADERRLVLMALMQVLISTGAQLNRVGLNNLLRSAQGEYLDAIGETAMTPRLAARAAKTAVVFTLSAPRAQNTLIPAGRRVTPDGALFFATDAVLVIPAGELSGTVEATCAEVGIVGNGYLPGGISTLVDPVPYVASVRNAAKSAGGSEAESDDSYRERIRTSPASYSTAGSILAYEYWARSAHVDVADVHATSPAAGSVEITVLSKDGQPSEQVLDAVREACSGSAHRPITDFVSAKGAELVPYDVALTYYAPASALSAVRTAVEGSGGALDAYCTWQSQQLGRAINPNQLLVLLTQAGAAKVELDAPSYAQLTMTQAAQLRQVSVSSAALLGV